MTMFEGRVGSLIGGWLAIGIFSLFANMFILPSRTGYTISVYIFLLLPSLILIFLNLGKLKGLIDRKEILFCMLFVCYLATTSLWGDIDQFASYLKRTLIIFVAGFGVYVTCQYLSKQFEMAAIAALAIVGLVCGFWIVDFYLLMDNSFSLRFLEGAGDFFHIYKGGSYGAFFNSLRLSHALTFMFCLALVLLFYLPKKTRLKQSIIVLSLIPVTALIIFAQTRTAWVICSVVMLAAIYYRWNIKGIVVALGLGALMFLVFPQIDYIAFYRGLSYRPQIWLAALNQVNGGWMFGHGMGSDMRIYIEEIGTTFVEAHNIYLMVLFYGGLVALALLSLMIIELIKTSWLKKGFSPWNGIWLVLFLLGGMTDGGGLLTRPNEHWFTIVIPLAFLFAHPTTANRFEGR